MDVLPLVSQLESLLDTEAKETADLAAEKTLAAAMRQDSFGVKMYNEFLYAANRQARHGNTERTFEGISRGVTFAAVIRCLRTYFHVIGYEEMGARQFRDAYHNGFKRGDSLITVHANPYQHGETMESWSLQLSIRPVGPDQVTF